MLEPNRKAKVAILGAGFSGLFLSHFLLKNGIEADVYETKSRAGGVAGSFGQEDGFCIETGPNSILDSEPSFKEMISDLKLEDQIVYANAAAKRRYIYLDKKMQKAPFGPLTFSEKFEFFKYLFASLLGIKKTKLNENETLYDYFSKKFGKAFTEKVFTAVFVGIYGSPIKKLSAKDCALKFKRGKLITFKNGTQTLIDALVKQLGPRLKFRALDPSEYSSYESIVFSYNIKDLPTAPIVSLSMAFSEPVLLNGFGCIVHPKEGKKTLGILSPSEIFEGRAPKNLGLLTLIMGGDFNPNFASQTDEEILKTAKAELHQIIGDLPEITKTWLFKYPKGIPMYTLESMPARHSLKSEIESQPGRYLHSTLIGGVSISDIARKSLELAARIKYNSN